jgi:hypothetical protein
VLQALKDVLYGKIPFRSLKAGTSKSDYLSFYGGTPTTQPTAAAQAAVTTTAIAPVADPATTNDIAAAVNLIITRQALVITLVNRLRYDLVTSFNLLKGS